MKIVVCLHATPPRGAPISENDLAALRLARALQGDHEVVALLAGTKDEIAPLQAALAAGVDRAARISGESFAAADFHTLGQVIGSAALTLGADLILAGARSDTEGLGALTASVARHMGLPHLANVESLERLTESPLALAATVRGGGRKRRLGITLPFVVSVARGSSASPPVAPRGPREPLPEIETLALFDPEVTVIRRRTEILGSSAKIERETKPLDEAIELIAALTASERR